MNLKLSCDEEKWPRKEIAIGGCYLRKIHMVCVKRHLLVTKSEYSFGILLHVDLDSLIKLRMK